MNRSGETLRWLLPIAAHKSLATSVSHLSADRFDRAYMSAMVKDHEQAIMKFEKQAEREGRGAIPSYAKKLLPILEAHLEQAKSINARFE